jgi:glutathione peroxidase
MSALLLSLATGMLATSMAPAIEPHSIYGFTMKTIDGQPLKLKHFKGKVLLVVNVASHCGYTPQYKALESVYQTYHERGFEVLGFPANNFGGQEPGSDPDIKQFCTATYNVTFPMFSKISVKGDDEHPLYKWLISESDRPTDDIEWNFSKFVIDKHGKVVARFKSKSTPDSPEVTAAIEKALAEQ